MQRLEIIHQSTPKYKVSYVVNMAGVDVKKIKVA